MLKSSLCHSEPHGRRISRRLFAEPVVSEILRSLRSLRMTRSEGLRVTLSNKCKSQRGFTLIELLLVIALTGIIGAAATMSIHQIFTGTALSNDQNTAINQVRNAGHWISRDVQMAKTVVPDNNNLAEFLTLSWSNWNDTEQYEVIYKLEDYGSSGLKKLVRLYSKDGSLEATTLIATNIVPPCDNPNDPAYHDTWCDEYQNGVFTMNISACNDSDYNIRNEYLEDYNKRKEVRAVQVKPRPD